MAKVTINPHVQTAMSFLERAHSYREVVLTDWAILDATDGDILIVSYLSVSRIDGLFTDNRVAVFKVNDPVGYPITDNTITSSG